jgi:hypothetical protein
MVFMIDVEGPFDGFQMLARPTESKRAIRSRLHESCCMAVESPCVNAGDNSCDTTVWQNFSHDLSRESQELSLPYLP